MINGTGTALLSGRVSVFARRMVAPESGGRRVGTSVGGRFVRKREDMGKGMVNARTVAMTQTETTSWLLLENGGEEALPTRQRHHCYITDTTHSDGKSPLELGCQVIYQYRVTSHLDLSQSYSSYATG